MSRDMPDSDNGNIAARIVCLWAGESGDRAIFSNEFEEVTRTTMLQMAEWRRRRLCDAICPGDAVIVTSLRGAAFFSDMLAVWAAGGVVVPLAGDATATYAQEVRSISLAKVVLDDMPGEEGGAHTELDCALALPEALAAIFFTSGTTGSPKGVMLSHASLAGNCEGTLEVVRMSGEKLFINTPFHYTSAICHFLACAFSESTLIGVEKKLFPADLTRAMIECGCTGFGGAPIQLRWIGEYCAAGRSANGSFLNLRLFISSGDNMPIDVAQSLCQQFPEAGLFIIYGLTELGGRFCILDTRRFPEKLGSVGRPIRGLHVHVAAIGKGNTVPAGEVGEVMATGSLLCLGYFNAPERTSRLFAAEGMRTGDVGHMDEDGFLFLHGRMDEVFKVNGQKVSGLIITEALMRISVFADVAVVSQDDPHFGAMPLAVYVLREGAAFVEGEVKAQLRQWMSANHIPRRFVQVEYIPRTGSGKLQKAKLREIVDGAESKWRA